MPRPFALALVALALAPAARAADPKPEELLPAGAQLYVRWDGVAAHADAYRKSVWGPLMAGPTGDSVRTLLAKLPRLLGASVLAEPLLDGRPPAELKQSLADLKGAEQVVGLLTDKGVILAAEVREPAPTLKGIGGAVTGLFSGKLPGPEAVVPDAHLFVLVPDAGDNGCEAVFGALRLLLGKSDMKIEPLAARGRKGFRLNLPGGGGPVQPHVAWWAEGAHFVFYAGTRKPEVVMAEMVASAAKGGLTANPLFQRCLKTGEFESVARGFADTGKVVGLAKSLAGPFVPGLRERLDGVGLGNLKAVVFSSGFAGKESRAVWEFDTAGEREGLAKVLKGGTPLGLNDLPPMPPDVSRFSALRIDPAAAYDAGIGLVEFFAMNEEFGVEEDDRKKGPNAVIAARKEFMMRAVDKFLGVRVREELLPHLGDKFVMFQSPTEGLSIFGQVVCISCKDVAKVKAATDNMQRALEGLASSPVKVRKRVVKGVEMREFYARGFGVVYPTYAFVGEWLVIGGCPQTVAGVILRAKGDLEKWKPDAETAARLAKMPQDGCGLQFCNPRSTVQNLCCIGPLFFGVFELNGRFSDNGETDFSPLEAGLIPNGHELSKHLFPNLTVTRDDGKTIRIEVNESFSLPLEFIGFEPAAFALTVFGRLF